MLSLTRHYLCLCGLLVLCAMIVVAPAWALSPSQMDAGGARTAQMRKALYEKFLPTPEELGPGWRLPWQLPPQLRRFHSEDQFWRSADGVEPADSEDFLETAALGLLSASPSEAPSLIDDVVAMISSEMPAEMLPRGISPKRFALSMLLIQVRASLSPSLARELRELADHYVPKMIVPQLRAAIEGLQRERAAMDLPEPMGYGEEAMSDADSSDELLLGFLQPVQGLNESQIRQTILDEISAVRRMTTMVYAKSNNWSAISPESTDLARIHLGQVKVKLVVFERRGMTKRIDDLDAQGAARLEASLNEAFSEAFSLMSQLQGSEQERDSARLEANFRSSERASQEQVNAVEQQYHQELRWIDEDVVKLRREMQSARSDSQRRTIQEKIDVADQGKEAARMRRARMLAELRSELNARRLEVEEQIEQTEQEYTEENLAGNLSSLHWNVSLRDIGDNSYVIALEGVVDLPAEYSSVFPISVFNANLRNGTAVVTISLQGNFRPEQFREELDRFLSEMDARTAFFRE